MQVYGGWPFSGEVDIMEVVGPQTIITHALHFGGPWDRCTSITEECRCPITYVLLLQGVVLCIICLLLPER